MFRMPEAFNEKELPELLDKSRLGVMFSLVLPVAIALSFSVLKNLFYIFAGSKDKKGLEWSFSIISVALICLIVFSYPPSKLYKGRYEYDIAAEKYLEIRNNYERLDWTIVGPHEQQEQAIGSGYHYQIYDLVREFTYETVTKSDFEFKIPTHHVFFYTEKVPLYYLKRITPEDAEKELPRNVDDPFATYYRTDVRGILEAKAIKLLEGYKATHSNMSIFYEDENMRIYYLYQTNPEKFGK
jgi:hypothetical protein